MCAENSLPSSCATFLIGHGDRRVLFVFGDKMATRIQGKGASQNDLGIPESIQTDIRHVDARADMRASISDGWELMATG